MFRGHIHLKIINAQGHRYSSSSVNHDLQCNSKLALPAMARSVIPACIKRESRLVLIWTPTKEFGDDVLKSSCGSEIILPADADKFSRCGADSCAPSSLLSVYWF